MNKTQGQPATTPQQLGTCSAFHKRQPCPHPAVKTGVAGCVHEHIKTVAHCECHVSTVDAGTIRCHDCLLAGYIVRIEVIYQ